VSQLDRQPATCEGGPAILGPARPLARRPAGPVGLVLALCLLASCGGSPSSSHQGLHSTGKARPALVWAEQVCEALTTWSADTTNAGVDFSNQATNSPNSPPATSRDQIVAFLGSVVKATGKMVDKAKSTGHPQVKGGQRIADGLVSALAQIEQTYLSAQQQARNLPLSSPQAFNHAAGDLTQSLIGVNTKAKDAVSAAEAQDGSGLLKKAFALAPSCRGLPSLS
jgi:hypothetical protein